MKIIKPRVYHEPPDADWNTVGRGWAEPAVGICENCNADVELRGFTNTCECGADYNMSGERLAPREQWGWDTGESVDDILAIDRMTTDELLEED